MQLGEKALGEEHPDTLTSMGKLAITYSLLGRLKDAEELQVRVTKANVRTLGNMHPNMLRSMGNLAVTYNK